ncbi:hypothetical protein SAMN05660657_05407, partial [Geodermatophilus amargosae]
RAAGEPIVTEQVVPADPEVTVTEGEAFSETTTTTAPAEPVVTVERTPTDSVVVVTEAPGAPIVMTQTRITGSCVRNPGQGNQANAC